MERGNVKVLARRMQLRKDAEEKPFVLVLGAGASFSSGAPLYYAMMLSVLENFSSRDLRSLSDADKEEEFFRVLTNSSEEDRYLMLHEFFSQLELSPGYSCLAELAKLGYFGPILSTNIDWLLEDAFGQVGLAPNKDYALFVVGKDSESEIARQLRFLNPSLKLVKLHGDLLARIFKILPEEIFTLPEKLRHAVKSLLDGHVIIVGHSVRDVDLAHCIRQDGEAIWYVNPERPSTDAFINKAMRTRKAAFHINGSEGEFDKFFLELHRHLTEADTARETAEEEVVETVAHESFASVVHELREIQDILQTTLPEICQNTQEGLKCSKRILKRIESMRP